MRLYNPKNGAEFDTESDDELHNQVYLDMGWEPAPEPEQKPGYEPEPVTYAPVTSTSSVPPKSGRGSGRDEWATYAEEHGFGPTDDMTRDEIIEAVEGST
jgi:hypothetical protein